MLESLSFAIKIVVGVSEVLPQPDTQKSTDASIRCLTGVLVTLHSSIDCRRIIRLEKDLCAYPHRHPVVSFVRRAVGPLASLCRSNANNKTLSEPPLCLCAASLFAQASARVSLLRAFHIVQLAFRSCCVSEFTAPQFEVIM